MISFIALTRSKSPPLLTKWNLFFCFIDLEKCLCYQHPPCASHKYQGGTRGFWRAFFINPSLPRPFLKKLFYGVRLIWQIFL